MRVQVRPTAPILQCPISLFQFLLFLLEVVILTVCLLSWGRRRASPYSSVLFNCAMLLCASFQERLDIQHSYRPEYCAECCSGKGYFAKTASCTWQGRSSMYSTIERGEAAHGGSFFHRKPCMSLFCTLCAAAAAASFFILPLVV